MSNQVKATGVTLGLLWLLWPKKGTAKAPDLSDVTIAPPTSTTTGAEGAQGESFLGLTGYSRGIRNNNPGNIKFKHSNNWDGKIPFNQNTDKIFEQFISFDYGVRAMIQLLDNYIDRDGRNTPKKIIEFWDHGNPSYLTFLINETGFSEHQILQVDKPTLKALSQAIVKRENPGDFLTDARFETGYQLYLNLT